MTLFVLDTDHLSLFQRGYGPLLPRIRAVPASRMAITIISIEEMGDLTPESRTRYVRANKSFTAWRNAYRWR